MSIPSEGTRVPGTSEDEPLLGSTGDASLPDGRPIYHNLYLGTGVLAQVGAWVITVITWGAVFSSDLILFSAHPLLNSTAFLFFIQALLVLQPTHTAEQKRQGTYVHAAFIDVALLSAIAGLVVIEYNKFDHNGNHLESAHAILGLVAYIFVILQALVGISQYFLPGLYGGVDNAKSIYKYHRVGGYVTVLLLLATICAATYTTFNITTLGIQLWAIVVSSVVLLLGLVPRIRLTKFGWLAGK